MIPATAHFQVRKTIGTTPDRLWHLLTDAKARETWGAPSDDDVLMVDLVDTREDGAELHRCGPKEAPDYTVATRWYRMEAPSGACFTETVEAGGMRIATSLVSYTLSPEGAGTTLIVDVSTCSFVGEEALADFEGGWNSALPRLEALAEKEAA